MLYLYQSQESGKYLFYNDNDFTFLDIASFTGIEKGYHRFCNGIRNSSYTNTPTYTLVAASPTIESFPDLYPEFFI